MSCTDSLISTLTPNIDKQQHKISILWFLVKTCHFQLSVIALKLSKISCCSLMASYFFLLTLYFIFTMVQTVVMIITALSSRLCLSCLSVGILKMLQVNESDIFENSRLWGARETVFWGVVCIQISFH